MMLGLHNHQSMPQNIPITLQGEPMQKQILIRSIFMLAAAAPLGAHASPLGAKPGAWEATTTTVMSGITEKQMPNIPKEQLDKMSPEQRAQVENMMNLRNGKPVTMTRKSCVKDTDNMDKLTSDDPARKDCKKKIISQTATSIEVEVNCTKPRTSTVRIKVEATSPENVTSITDMQGEGGVKMHIEGKSHWISASCEGIAPQPAMHNKK
jgi:hypothetical protein